MSPITRDARLGPLRFPTALGDLKETLGDSLEAVGAVALPGERRPRPFSLQLPVHAIPSDGALYLTVGDRLRRQVRALIENPKARGELLWFQFDIDTDLNAWLLVGGGDLSYTEQGTTFADYLLELADCYKAGDRSTHRPARRLQVRDRRLSTEPRDTLGRVRSTDFAALSTLARHWLPVNATDLVGAQGTTLPQGVAVATADGSLQLVCGRANSDVVSYEQPAADEGRAAVAIYDRQGTITAPAAAPDAAWEAVYGPAQALTAADVPVLENARCRVRYDATNTPGFRVDVWTGAAWAEQGKVIVYRRDAAGAAPLDTLVSAAVVEWTPERAVLQAVMRVAARPESRERVFITLQRGWSGPRLEVYPALRAAGTPAGASIVFHPAQIDANVALAKLDAAGAAQIAATAGTGAAVFAGTSLSTFTGENELALLRQGAAYTAVFAVVQAALTAFADFGNVAYGGANRSAVAVIDSTSALGYTSVQLGFHAQQADQVMEAEAMTLAAGTASVADAAASGGNAAQASRTADAVHVSKATWPAGAKGKHRVFVRVRPLTNADVINVYAKTAATTGATKTQSVNTFNQVDLGEIVADGSTLEIHAWNATAARTFNVDRVETVKLEDRTATVPAYDGARDIGQATLLDCRQCQRLLPRGAS